MSEPWVYSERLQRGEQVLDEREQRHAFGSLRLRAGDALTLFDGAGRVARATVAAGERSRARPRLRVDAVIDVAPPTRRLTLIVAACKGARLEWMVEKTTELGVSRLVIAEFERSVVHAGAQHVERLRRTAIEACKQCRRAWLPVIEAGTPLDRAIASRGEAPLLIAHPAEGSVAIGAWLQRQSGLRELAVCVGPEGGLADGEVARLQAAAAALVCLGRFTLRVETAAVAATACWAAAEMGGSRDEQG